MPQPLIPMPPIVVPSGPKTITAGTLTMSGVGGTGPYTFSMYNNSSGGSITSGGSYTAGSSGNCVDTIQMQDSLGNLTYRDVNVFPNNAVTPTLANLRTAAQNRCDLANSSFITSSEWTNYLNGSAYELYDKLVTAYDNNYNVAPDYIFQTDGITQRYPLPYDFFKLLGIDVQVSQTQSGWLRVPKFNYGDRDKFMTPYQIFYGIRTNLHYRLDGQSLWLIPIPAGGQYIRILYVPRMTALVNETDVIDGISGWEEYVIIDAAIKANVKRETPSQELILQKAAIMKRVDDIAENRDAGSVSTVVDTRSQDDWYSWPTFGRGGP